jgi:hypothetical protein
MTGTSANWAAALARISPYISRRNARVIMSSWCEDRRHRPA